MSAAYLPRPCPSNLQSVSSLKALARRGYFGFGAANCETRGEVRGETRGEARGAMDGLLSTDSASAGRLWGLGPSDGLRLLPGRVLSSVDTDRVRESSDRCFAFWPESDESKAINVANDATLFGESGWFGVAGRDIQIPSTSMPFCMARTPNGMLPPRLTGRPAFRIPVKRALFSSTRASCFRMIRFVHHSFPRPIQKTITMLKART